MKQWIKKITGIADIEQAALAAQKQKEETESSIQQLLKQKHEAELQAQQAQREAEFAKLSPKEKATVKKEPWVGVLNTHVNHNDIRNGFFELDWNEYFIIELRSSGYGFDGDKEDEIVERWFKDIIFNLLEDHGYDPSRPSGMIDVRPISGDRSAVS